MPYYCFFCDGCQHESAHKPIAADGYEWICIECGTHEWIPPLSYDAALPLTDAVVDGFLRNAPATTPEQLARMRELFARKLAERQKGSDT